MFTIEQSGGITKANTIDDLINEYIKQCVNKYVIINCGRGSNGGSLNETDTKKTVKKSIEKESLKYVSKEELEGKINEAIKGIQLPVVPDDLVSEESLTNTLKDCALKTKSLTARGITIAKNRGFSSG